MFSLFCSLGHLEEQQRRSSYLLYSITFLLSVLPALFYTAPAFEDGLGTMATAAYLSGYDWSAFLAADGYYYKYGQSLWYLLPFLLIPHAVARYRVMLVINSMLTSLIPVLAWRIAVRELRIERRTAFMISFLTGIYPPILLYNKYTWAEPNLMVLPWVILLLLLRLYGVGAAAGENAEKEGKTGKTVERAAKKRRTGNSILLAAAAVYAFMSHQRGIILIIAVSLTLVFLQWRKMRGICWPAYLGTLGGGLLLDRVLSGWQKANVYAGAVMEHNTLRDFLEPELYRKLFSAEGMRTVADTAAGWLFHSGASTFGIAFLGLLFMLGFVGRRRREKAEGEACLIISIQGLLSYFGAFALGVLFFFQDLYGYFDGSKVTRCDHLLFGRYLESSLPVLVFMGLIGLWLHGKKGESARKESGVWYGAERGMRVAVLLLLGGVTVWSMLRLFPQMEQVDCYVHSLMALNLFMDTGTVRQTLAMVPNYVQALAMFAGVSFVISVFLLSVRGRRGRYAGAAVLCVLFLWIYVWNSVTVTGRVDSYGETKYGVFYLEEGEDCYVFEREKV